MGRPRSNPLPSGIYERRHRSGRRTYWIDFRDANGERVREPGGTTIDDAIAKRRARLAEVADGTFARALGSIGQSLSEYSERWIEHRRTRGVRTVDREHAMLRDHVLPTIGRRPLADVRPRDVAELVEGLAGKLAPKSIRNVHGVVSAMLSRARLEGLVADNAAKGLPRGTLPRNVRVRQISAWTRAEIETWITPHPDVPEDRTVGYAIAAFAGARLGEIAGLRWTHLDTDARPLWRWALRSQYDGEPLKTDNPRDIPIHPELARILAAWKLEGWPRLMCRHPTPDDFVLPRPIEQLERHPLYKRIPHHNEASLGARAVRRHARHLGIDPAGRDFHSFRRSMITLARTDGAREEVLERVTHNAEGTQIDGYTYFGWEPLCEAVACIRAAPRAGIVVALPAAGHAAGHAAGGMVAMASVFQASEMESRGIEPPSGGRSIRLAAVSGGSRTAGPTRGSRAKPPAAASVPAIVTRVPGADASRAIEALRRAGRADLAAAVEAALRSEDA